MPPLRSQSAGQSTRESAAVTGTVSLKNATVDEVQDQVVGAQGSQALFQPGRWEGSAKIVDIKLGGINKPPLPLIFSAEQPPTPRLRDITAPPGPATRPWTIDPPL